jgi:serralysin
MKSSTPIISALENGLDSGLSKDLNDFSSSSLPALKSPSKKAIKSILNHIKTSESTLSDFTLASKTITNRNLVEPSTFTLTSLQSTKTTSTNAFGAATASIATTATFDNNIDALLSDNHWASPNVTFSFTSGIDDYEAGYPNLAVHSASFQVLSGTQQNIARSWLNQSYASVSSLAPIELVGTGDRDATIRMAISNDPQTAYAYFPNSSFAFGGDIWFNPVDYNNPVIGNYAYFTFGHEAGHALGLNHGHEGTGIRNVAMDSNRDSMEFSIMTYRSFVGHNLVTNPYLTNEADGFAQSLMMYDIRAIQQMYGASFDYQSSNTTYTFSTTTGEMFINGISQGTPSANRVFRTVWDGNGIDTYNFSNYSTNLAVDLTAGGWSDLDVGGYFQKAKLGSAAVVGTDQYARGHVFNALQFNGDQRSLIENANAGTGNDSILGNTADNVLNGNNGNDTLNGGDGNDGLYGGADNDGLYGGTGNDILRGGTGADILDGGLDIDYASYYDFTGSTLVVNLLNSALNTGDALGDTFANIEYLQGSLTANNQLSGDNNNNNLLTYNGDDIISGNAGNDGIRSGSGNDGLYGGTGNDSLYGEAGNDILRGGTGSDILDGGADIDYVSYYDATSTTLVVNLLNSALNTGDAFGDIFVSIEYIQGSLTANNNLTGNNSNNYITGFNGNDTLSSGIGDDTLSGDAGNNSLSGGADNDTYIVISAGDIITEAVNQGNDNVQSSVSFTLNANVENLLLTDTATSGTGNSLSNLIYGNTAANSLVGNDGNDTLLGNDGIDYLYGGNGNDSLNGGNDYDVLKGGSGADTLNGGAGNDIASYYEATTPTLVVNLSNTALNTGDALGDIYIDIEWLQGSGTGNNNLTGNANSNNLYGYNGNDTLNGGGGNDALSGGNGNDRFHFSGGAISTTVTSLIGIDTIVDFAVGVDKVVLSKSTFTAITSSANTAIGTNFAIVANDTLVGASSASIVYSQTTGSLFYNADLTTAGLGAKGGQFAKLTNNPIITANDFAIIA